MAKKKSKKLTASQKWAKTDRYPVIFWIPGKTKKSLRAKAKKSKTSMAALFLAWANAGFPAKLKAKAPKKTKRAAKHKPAANGAIEASASA